VFCADVVDFVTPLKKRRLARESLSIDGSLRSISEEEDSLSARTASPPDAMPPSGTVSAAEPELTSAVSTNECLSQVRILYSCFCGHHISLRQLPKSAGEVFFYRMDAFCCWKKLSSWKADMSYMSVIIVKVLYDRQNIFGLFLLLLLFSL